MPLVGPILLAGFLCAMVLAIATGTLIGTVLLRAAIALYNKMVGGSASPRSIPEPSFGQAMGIALLTCSINAVGFVVGLGASWACYDHGGVVVFAQVISLLISVLILVRMLTIRLPTSLRRALGVTLLCCAIAIVLAMAIAMVVLVVVLVTR
jgi:hypothetical protein